MFRLRTLGTTVLLFTLAASLLATGCRRRPKVVYVPTPGPAGAAGPAGPGATPGSTVINLTLNITASSSGLTRITTDPGDEFEPAVSPDGKTLLFGVRITNSANTVEQLAAELEVGNLSINHFTASLAETPFGGVKDSGYGREGGTEGLVCYTVVKNVSHLTTAQG